MYAVPKDSSSDCKDVHEEFKEIFATKFPKIKDWRCRKVEKNYAFEMPIENGTSNFLEIRYKGKYPAMPQFRPGRTFTHVLGTNTSLLELLIIQKQIMGPCWITIKNPGVTHEKQTWCDFEVICEPKQLEVTLEDRNRESPVIKALSFALKTHKGANK